MSPAALDDPVLRRFRDALYVVYGKRIDRVVLYGSRARGDHHRESDYDIAVFLNDLSDRWFELDRLADLSSSFLGDTGELIHAMAYRASVYEERTSLMREIRRDGIEL